MVQKTTRPMLLAVSAPPFLHSGRSITQSSRLLLLALAPAALMAVWHWGLPAARVMALAMCTGVVTEAICQKITQRKLRITDFSVVVTSLLFAFLLPAAAPWWIVCIGTVLAVTLGCIVFGGFGCNPVNSALVGWAMLYISWPALMDPNAMQLDTMYIDPLVRLKFFGAPGVHDMDLGSLLLGFQIGGLGATQGLALLLGGIFVVYKGIVRWEIPLAFFAGVLLPASIFYIIDPAHSAQPLFHIVTGGTLLGGFFLATEWASSPARRIPMLIYGFVAGVLVMIIRRYGLYPDGVPFAILLANLLAPLLDDIRPKPFGDRR